jgi:uncharacterized protein with NAD-binding domain and iron-sulfur cluster
MKRPSVAIFGGGVGGLTTAHELVERGFNVEVFDQKAQYWGGKARSNVKRGSGTQGRADLPGEHGFRFFPGFYKHLPDTMGRIPFPGNANGVLDNLVPTKEFALYQEKGQPYIAPVNFPETSEEWFEAIKAWIILSFEISTDDIEFFVTQLLKLACSCQARLDYEFDSVTWWDYIQAGKRGSEYQKILAQGLTRSLVAIQASESSTRTVGTMLLQLIYNMITPGVEVDRVLNGPTNDRWLNAWTTYLTGKGVVLNLRSTVTKFNMKGAKLGSVTVDQNGVARDVVADYYVSAVPVEKMARFLSPEMLAAAPDLAKIKKLKTEWMNGIQFYLGRDVPVVKGHVVYVDSKWAITSISQHQFWKGVQLKNYGDGKVKGILSVDISDWNTPGNKKVLLPAKQCSAEQIKTETWAEIKAHLGDMLQDSDLIGWYLDPDINWGNLSATPNFNKEPLLINRIGSLQWRPPAATQIPNLMLAADYVNTYTNLACMEGANEAGRRATNAILDAMGSKESRCDLWPYKSPLIFKLAQDADQLAWDLTHPKAVTAPVIA